MGFFSFVKIDFHRKAWAILTKSERRSATLIFGLMLIGMGLEVLGVGLIIPVIAFFTHSDISVDFPIMRPLLDVLGNPSQQKLAIYGVTLVAVIYTIKALFLALCIWMQKSFTYNLLEQVSLRLFDLYMHKPYVFHLRHNSALLIRNITEEAKQFAISGVGPMMLIMADGLIVIGISVVLFLIEPKGTISVAAILVAVSWGYHRYTKPRLEEWGAMRQKHLGHRLQHIQQGLGGIKEIKLHGRESESIAQFHFHNSRITRVAKLHTFTMQLPRLWLELLAVFGLVALAVISYVQGRSADALLPILGMFAVAAFRLIPAVNRILVSGQEIKYGLPAIDVLYAEFSQSNAPVEVSGSSQQPFQRNITLNEVSYSYFGATEKALERITITIQRGESIGIIGSSGAGKSTLVNVLLGLLIPDDGKMLVDKDDIRMNLRHWQDQIGYVPQSIFLTDDTLLRNIAFGVPSDQIDMSAVKCAMQDAQLEEFVKSLPMGLDTKVGERGVRLSGGQLQRIGIARALYHDPAVLVFDESTSALDIATEREVMGAVDTLQDTKTLIIVSHRLSTVENCDRLFRLERGKLVQEGTPDQVLETISNGNKQEHGE